MCYHNEKKVDAKLMAINEVSKQVAVKTETIRRWITVGARGRKLEGVLRGGRWFTTMEAVNDFFDAPPEPIGTITNLTQEEIHKIVGSQEFRDYLESKRGK